MSVTDRIVNMRADGMRFGTERTRALLDKLGSPDEKLKIIHVSGTNGKGSVCAYLTSILLADGKTVGTYTTPEVFSFEEQFCINGEPLRTYEKYLRRVQQAADGMADSPTAYERQTAAAFLMFAGERCEYAVVECCIGGLEDTTNAVNKKLLAVVTSVSLEHTKYLGDTLEKIARHKVGIINNCPSVISRCVPQEVRPIFFNLGAVIAEEPCDIRECEGGTYFDCGGQRYFTKMLGCRQPYNATTAITAAKILGIGDAATVHGIAQAEIPGRLQLIRADGRDYILDGAHNPESFIPLAAMLVGRYAGRERGIIYGCLSDKDIGTVLNGLKGCAEHVVGVRPDSYRAMDFDKIISECRAVFADVGGAASMSEALESCRGDVVAVCGTFTFLKEAREWIEKRL